MNSTLCAIILLLTLSVRAETLRFTGGSVGTNYSSVLLTIAGPTNLVCSVERLNRTNDVWEPQGEVSLGTTGVSSFNSTLQNGYGFFRTKSTNGTYRSTNAFGAVTALLGSGTSFIGNPFGPTRLTNIFPEPADDMRADKLVNGTGWVTSTYDSGWSVNHQVGTFDALSINIPTNETAHFIVSGLFDTNTITTAIPSGFSAWCLPLYHVSPTNSWIVDTFNTNQLGGLSVLPVQSSGFLLQCTLNQLIDNLGNYSVNRLTNNAWNCNGTNVTLSFELAEGFIIEKPTNATWTVNRTIW